MIALVILIVIIAILTTVTTQTILATSIDEDKESDSTPSPDGRCLFDPDLPHCAVNEDLPDNECPEGFNRNAYDQCYPSHPEGCPEGYHGHEDDETGRCIPDDVPCEDGYVMDPDFPTCNDKDRVCEEHPNADVCRSDSELIECDDGREVSDPAICAINQDHDCEPGYMPINEDECVLNEMPQTIACSWSYDPETGECIFPPEEGIKTVND